MVGYTPESAQDLNRLRIFIAEKSPTAARRITSEIKQSINRLNDFPMLGIEVISAPNPKQIRDLFIGDYTVRYLVTGTNIYILRLWHDKENERNLS